MSERPQVGDRVLVQFEATVLEVDDKDTVGLPYRVAYGKDDKKWIWVPGESTTLLPAQSERSDTELERRLVALETRLGFDKAWTEAMGGWQNRTLERIEVLERQMASLRSLLHNAGNV